MRGAEAWPLDHPAMRRPPLRRHWLRTSQPSATVYGARSSTTELAIADRVAIFRAIGHVELLSD
jgi:hypothetical protein